MWGIVLICITSYIVVAGVISYFWDEHRYGYRDYWYNDFYGSFLVLGWIIAIPLIGIFTIGRIIAYFFQCLFENCRPRRKKRRYR